MTDEIEYGEKRAEEVVALGSATEYKYEYCPEVLETFENVHPGLDYWVTLNAPEFTSICPKTNQPDFATIIINYIPHIKMVESKSLKLYFFGYINKGEFHEDTINTIRNDLTKLMEPKYLEVIGIFYPRGNISIHPVAYYNNGESKYMELEKYRFQNYKMNNLKAEL